MLDQLELFQILSVEQQEDVNNYIERENKRVADRKASIGIMVELLKEAGFNDQYRLSYKSGNATVNREFGYGDSSFNAEVTVNTVNGSVRLIHKRHYGGELQTVESSVSREGNKLICSQITPQYRAYKPSSLLAKLNEYNQEQNDSHNSFLNKRTILNYTMTKYEELYPNAVVQQGTGYQGGSSFTTVLVSFPKGKDIDGASWVEFRLGFKQDGEYMFKKFDANVDKLKGMDLLNHFNEQK